jgi:hypothetical protein
MYLCHKDLNVNLAELFKHAHPRALAPNFPVLLKKSSTFPVFNPFASREVVIAEIVTVEQRVGGSGEDLFEALRCAWGAPLWRRRLMRVPLARSTRATGPSPELRACGHHAPFWRVVNASGCASSSWACISRTLEFRAGIRACDPLYWKIPVAVRSQM